MQLFTNDFTHERRPVLRYNRQMMLPQMDYEGQDILLSSRVLIIGLGSPAAMYLAAAGVGTLVLVD